MPPVRPSLLTCFGQLEAFACVKSSVSSYLCQVIYVRLAVQKLHEVKYTQTGLSRSLQLKRARLKLTLYIGLLKLRDLEQASLLRLLLYLYRAYLPFQSICPSRHCHSHQPIR
jgi:hypothetical protein